MPDADVISWLARRAIPVDSLDPTAGCVDLAPIRHSFLDNVLRTSQNRVRQRWLSNAMLGERGQSIGEPWQLRRQGHRQVRRDHLGGKGRYLRIDTDKAHTISEVLDQQASVSSSDEHANARRHAAYLVRSAQLATAPRDPEAGETSMYAVRDRLMADAVADMTRETIHNGPQIAVWAHNGHLRTGANTEIHVSMGSHLRKYFGREYYALGLMFGSGSFRAKRARLWGGTTLLPVKHRRGTAPPTTVEGYLAKAHPGDHLVDLHDQDAPHAVTEWLGTRCWTRQHGAVESPFYRLGFTPTVPGAEYDGLAYVHLTNPSTALSPS